MMKVLTSAMAVLAAFGCMAATASAAGPYGDGDVVRKWNQIAFSAARTASPPAAADAKAARTYAMVDAAMYDAVNGTAGVGEPRQAAIVASAAPVAGDPNVAAATAAHDVLAALYPSQRAVFDAQLDRDRAAAPANGWAEKGSAWGAQVAAGVLAARQDDVPGSLEVQDGSGAIGEFAVAWSGVEYRFLEPFAIADRDAFLGAGPPSLDGAEYAAAFDEVKTVGDARIVDEGKKATFDYWSLGGRTSQPAGAWLQVAAAVSLDRSLSLADTARLFALESMAMADTVAPTYMTKVLFHSWRPVTAIHRAAEDGNPDTAPDSEWRPRGGNAGSPEYWSGHSSFSSAGAAVLAGFFCDDQIPFSLVTDSAPGGRARTYDSFSAAAAEAGRSRVVGGLHFEFSNRAGAAAGQAVAAEVLSNALLLESGPTHVGSCPR